MYILRIFVKCSEPGRCTRSVEIPRIQQRAKCEHRQPGHFVIDGGTSKTKKYSVTTKNICNTRADLNMALYHFKKDVITTTNSNLNNSNSIITNSSLSGQSSYSCENCCKREHCVMLNRVNLGDVLRKTISDEMKSLAQEKDKNCLRFGGS